MPERDNPSVRAPESAKLKDLERKLETQLVYLVGFWVDEERFDDAVMGGVNARREIVWEVEDEHGGSRNAIVSYFCHRGICKGL